ncbi:LCP family protein [Erysipelothrix urinaevulpis]|uniref:LCP family glycopolymer transferase n=1 Tax=Erysipelothrix urinaevulpis TaxID=2683717 RepID=UPI00135AD4FD|nr:LCP family protein [Erysipelothrix urinaevulpis]
MKKTKNSVFNSPLAGIVLAVATNVFVVAIISMLNRYSKIYSRYYFIGVLIAILVTLIINMLFLIGYVKRKKSFRVMFVLLSFVLTIVLGLGTWYIYRGNSSIDKIINDMGVEELEFSLVSVDGKTTLKDLHNQKIAIVDNINPEFKKEVQDKVATYSENVEYISYDSYRELLLAARAQEYDLMLVPKDFRKLLNSPADETLFKDSVVLLTFSQKQDEDVSDVDVLNDPFSVLMLGNNEGLSDSIIVATFNPKTLKVTMTSLARDSYVPIACYASGSSDKLNHSRGVSRQCLIDTIEDFLDIEIDFYFETDFYALVKIVDTLGGLELESPVSFSGSLPIEGEVGKYEQIKVEKGKYVMNGKEAITFARERVHMPNGDFDRQLNQQYVIKELATKILSTRNVDTLLDVLDVAKDNIVMNIPIQSISALMGYSIEQMNVSPVDGIETFRIVQSQVAGTTPTINGMSVVMPYTKDIRQSNELINGNLKKEISRNDDKFFNFSFKEPYKLVLADPDMAGASESTLGSDSLFEMPDFSGWALDEIKSWGNNRGIAIRVEEVEGSTTGLLSQNPTSSTMSSRPSEVYIRYGVKKKEVEVSEPTGRTIEIPNMVGRGRDEISAWISGLKEDIVKYQIKELSNEEVEDGIILSQSVVGTHTINGSINIVFEVNRLENRNVQVED